MPTLSTATILSTEISLGDRIKIFYEHGTIIEMTMVELYQCGNRCGDWCKFTYMVRDQGRQMHCFNKLIRLEKLSSINSITEI